MNIVEDIGVGVYTVATWIGLAFPSRECFVYGFIDVGSIRQYTLLEPLIEGVDGGVSWSN